MGENETRNISLDDKLIDIERLIAQHCINVGLGTPNPSSECARLINMTATEMRKLDAIECGEAAAVLNQLALFIQLNNNKLQATLEWCQRNLDFIIAPHLETVGTQYTPYDVRKILATKQNDVAIKLSKIITSISLKLTATSYMPNQLRALASAFSDLQQTKRIKTI